MADYSDGKPSLGAVWPENATDTAYGRLEPLISPTQLRTRHLFGIPLVSQMRDPLTNKAMVMTDTMLQDFIDEALQTAELEAHIDIAPVQRDERHPFDRNLYEQFGYMQLHHKPCSHIEKLSVTPSNNIDVYSVPLDWVNTGYLIRGQINIVPLTIAFPNGGFIPSQSAGGALFLSIMGQRAWLPSFWQVRYTSGFKDGLVPRVINKLIGTIAALNILSQLAATHARSSSHSLGIDGVSQSVSTPGPQLFSVRIGELEADKKMLIGKIKSFTNNKFLIGTL
jgi:hypothetical protein